ncbi:MAG: Maf family protein [Christensenellales bacterium]|jgi:septum formation protein
MTAPFKPQKASKRLVLASSSPRRKMLLEQVKADFIIRIPDVDEAFNEELLNAHGLDAALCDVAKRKAQAVFYSMAEHEKEGYDFIVSADTIVCMDDVVYGKPHSEEEAFLMLKSIAGRSHSVKTGVGVINCRTGAHDEKVETTFVHIAPLSDGEIYDYILTGEPMDKAGAYAAQGIGARFVRRIEGCYYNVVGLPLGLMFDIFDDIC